MAQDTIERFAIREVGPDDRAGLHALFEGLDELSRYRRWFTGGPDINSAVRWSADPAAHNAVGLVATAQDGEIVGHAALAGAGDGRAEVCFEVAAHWRHQGVAGHLLEALALRGEQSGIRTLVAEVLADNADMLAVMREHGAGLEHRDGGVMELAVDVGDARRAVEHA